MLLRSCFTGILIKTRFFDFNTNVKCKYSALYIKEFANAAIYHHYPLLNESNNYYLSFSDSARKYDLRNKPFLKHEKLYLSIPEKWEGNSLISDVLPTTT